LARDEFDSEKYEEYEDRFTQDRQLRRSRKPNKAKFAPKKSRNDVLEEIVEVVRDLEGGFNPTYKPSKHEQGWLLSSLEGFYDQLMISDVLSQVRGGKEASVYCCKAHPTTGVDLLAAKVYRPRKFRQLRNDKLYREGRAVLTPEGRPVKKTDHRIMRAVGKKTAFGAQVSHTSWLMYEYRTLVTLAAAGAAVPQPFAVSENAILMSYYGSAEVAAPLLSEIRLEPDEAEPLFEEALRNIELMLQHGLIHGDLSAYNILYWDGVITLIDFPQVTDLYTNRNAYSILARDVQRVCDYFARQGVQSSASEIVARLWQTYGSDPQDESDFDL